ncbi:MAG: apolipoprotein N-acyltransferase [Azonexus sp.]|nr:apolipoprotein N-acyltransferase [Azonexus sp.]
MTLAERGGLPLLLSLGAGASGILCFAPFGLFWLAPLVWAVLFKLLQDARSPADAGQRGLAFGLGFFLSGVSWVYVSLSTFGGMPWWLAGPATLGFCTVAALYPAVAGWAYKRWQPAAFWQQALWFGGLIAAVDVARAHIFTGFPWLSLGYSQSPPSPLAGFAPLLGVFGLSLLVALAAASLSRWKHGLLVLGVLLASGQGLRQIAWTEAIGNPVSVALIQGNIPQEMKFQPESFLRTLALYRDLIAAHPAQLTLLPETALPAFIDQLPRDYLDELQVLAQRQGGDLIIGTLTGDGTNYFNSAVSLGSSPMQVYSKQHLVPFGEFIPPGFAWIMAQANIPMSSFSAGAAVQPPLQLGTQAVAVNICYEDVFGHEIIRALPHAGLLANLSNTAWFGHSLAQDQHLQIARLRALETGRPMLRATNTGMTAIIDAQGEVVSQLAPFETGVLRGEIRAHQGTTPYVRWGDWPAIALIALCLLASRIGRRRR